MLTTWLTLRQADEALKLGRLDEAMKLVRQPEVQGHKRAGAILQQIGQAHLRRAQLHLDHNDANAAWKDLLAAEQAGCHDKECVKLRQELVFRGLNEVKALLAAGDPRRAAELVDKLRDREGDHAELAVFEEVARSWSMALDLVAKGEFGQALAILDRAARQHFKPLEELRADVKHRRQTFDDLLGQLHRALERGRWREVIQLSDQVLAFAPQHAEAPKARAKAWKAVEPPTVAVGSSPAPTLPPEPEPSSDQLPRRMLLWIDGVGGYLICFSNRVSLGQATPDAYVDVPLFADVSRLHAYLTRDAEGYLLEAVRPTTVNQQAADKALLHDGDRITLGSSCQLRFHQPHAISATARLEITSGHRLALSVDGVLLMAENCILGPQGHVVVPDLPRPIVLVRRKEGLAVQTAGELVVDGKTCRDRAALGLNSSVATPEIRFSLEPVGVQLGVSR